MFEKIEQKDIDNFLKIFGGHILFQTLRAAVEFDLFTKLSIHKKLDISGIIKLLNIEKQPEIGRAHV